MTFSVIDGKTFLSFPVGHKSWRPIHDGFLCNVQSLLETININSALMGCLCVVRLVASFSCRDDYLTAILLELCTLHQTDIPPSFIIPLGQLRV